MEYIIEDTKTKSGERFVPMNADISITRDTYTHIKFEDAKVEFDRVMEA